MRRALHHFGIDGFVLCSSIALLAGTIAHFGGHLGVAGPSLVAPFWTFLPVIVFCAILRRREGLVRALGHSARDWAPFFLMNVVYRNLSPATHFLPSRSVEHTLLAIDQRIFGVEPSAWIQRFARPWLSDYMAFAYALMFLMPLVVMTILYWRGRRDDFREVGVAMILCTFAGFLLYIAFPARSPRWACPEIYGGMQLHGAFGIYEMLTQAWDHVELMLYDAFPSLHTAVSTLALVYSFRMGPRWLGWVMLPFVVSLQISTLYLRQHYFIDVLFGWLLAAACVALAPLLRRAWSWMTTRISSASSTARAKAMNAA
jgi:membrane-associated phospholipid phosphatase